MLGVKQWVATLQIQHGDNGAVLAPYAWSKNLACGVAWQNVVNSATHNTANLAWQVLVGKAKMGQCLGGGLLSLSLSLSSLALVARLWAKLKGFFAHFIAISSHLVANFSYFIVVLTHLFAYKRHFLGYFVFLKFLNALCLGFLRLSLQAVFAKTAWQSINSALLLLFGFPRSPCSLAMTDKENALYYFTMTADFVILSVATQRVARRKPQQKNPKNLRYALFLDTSLALSMTKFMTQRVFGMTKQIGMIILGCRLNFLEQMKNLKNLQIFLKNFY